jgi:hypothetical protein
MAVTKTIIKASEKECFVKIAGDDGTSIISLDTDLKVDNETLSTNPRQVNIAALQWTGETKSDISIVRNSVTVFTLNCGASGFFDMSGAMIPPDAIENASNIEVTISGGVAQLWLRLRKIDGYLPNIETSIYGSYDDQSVHGA